jgi:hypothetical protein
VIFVQRAFLQRMGGIFGRNGKNTTKVKVKTSFCSAYEMALGA